MVSASQPTIRASRKGRITPRHAVALMLFVLAISMAGCGGGSSNSKPCTQIPAGVKCTQSNVLGGGSLPDSPYGPRQ